MAVAQGIFATATTAPGTAAGALAWFETLLTNGKAPTSWYQVSTTVNSGPYMLVTSGGGGGTDSQGVIQWQDASGQTQHLYFAVASDGTVTSAPSTKNSADPSWLEKLGIWIANGGSSTPLVGVPGMPSQVPGNVVQGLMDSASVLNEIRHLFSAVTSAAFWKRIGIGAAGVGLLIIALIITLKGRKS